MFGSKFCYTNFSCLVHFHVKGSRFCLKNTAYKIYNCLQSIKVLLHSWVCVKLLPVFFKQIANKPEIMSFFFLFVTLKSNLFKLKNIWIAISG